MSISKTTAVIRRITAILLAVTLCFLLAPIAEAKGSTLTSSAYNATIEVGKTGALLITATGNQKLTASVSDSNVLSYKWDTKWTSDTTIKFYITGKKAGTSKVCIQNGKSESITINVTVKANDAPKSYGATSKLIKANTYSVSVNKGAQSSVKITSNNHSLVYRVGNSSIASVTPGKWSGNTVKFTVKGKKAGTTYLTVYRKNDKSVAANIKITVGSQDSSSSSSNKNNNNNNKNNNTQKPAQTEPTEKQEQEPAVPSGNYAEQMLALVNQARAEAGVAPLTLDSTLCSAADLRAVEITSVFSHTRPDGRDCFSVFNEFGVSCYGGGENIAGGSSDAAMIFNMWMNSPGHRSNILNPSFRSIGIGKSGVYWVQLFIM